MNLLIVDDQSFEIEAHKKKIDTSIGISQIYTALNGEEARRVLSAVTIDILLCDIEMPVCNGLELLEWIRDHEIPLECIFLTSFPDFAYAKKAISLECLDYIVKPVSRNVLNDVLTKAIKKILLTRSQSSDFNYSSLWFSHQPYLIDAFWSDLLSGHIEPTQSSIRCRMAELNCPGMEVMKILPVFIQLPESRPAVNASRRIIINNVMKALAQETIVSHSSYGTLIEYQTNQYFFIVYEEYGLRNAQLRLMDGCTDFFHDVNKILHFTPTCYIGKEIYPFQLPEHKEYLISISQNNVSVDDHVFFYDLLRKNIKTAALPDLKILQALLDKNLYEDIVAYYKNYFLQLTYNIIDHQQQIFILKQDFLQIFFEYTKRHKVNIRTFWEDTDVQNLYRRADSSVTHFIQLISKLCQMVSEKIAQLEQPKSVVAQAIQYIHQHLGEDITRQDVAMAVSMNSDYFSKLFKKETGLLISEYLLNTRISLAQELLKSTMSITDIAMETGFNSFSYFSTTFKKCTGRTPTEYQKMQKVPDKQ